MTTDNIIKSLPRGYSLRTENHSYEIVEEISRGGFGITYKVKNKQNFCVGEYMVPAGETLVLKECCRSSPETPSMERLQNGLVHLRDRERGALVRRQFLAEARAMEKLQKAFPLEKQGKLTNGFVPIYHAGASKTKLSGKGTEPDYEADNIIYLVMPFIPGGNLKRKISTGASFAHIAYWLYEILNGLQYIHTGNPMAGGLSMLHCDIKPSNIMLTEKQEALLIDFGGVIEDNGNRVTSRVMTPAYASPEQILHKPLKPSSDLYSLAASFYELITGTRILPAKKRIESDSYHSLSQRTGLISKFDAAWEQLMGRDNFHLCGRSFGKVFLQGIDRALSMIPEQRWTSAEEWRNGVYGNSQLQNVFSHPPPVSTNTLPVSSKNLSLLDLILYIAIGLLVLIITLILYI